MNRIILIAILCLSSVSLFSQQQGPWYMLSGKSMAAIKTARPKRTAPFLLPVSGNLSDRPDIGTATKLPNPAPLPAAWKYEELAVFCRLEVKLEQFASFPIKFRIGEVQEVEKLEGKY